MPDIKLTREQKALVDEFGLLAHEREQRAPKEKRYADLAAEIRTWFPGLAADQTALLIGTHFEIQISEKSIVKSWISIAAVCKAVGGAKKFQQLAVVTFKALAGVIGNSAAEALQTEAQTGYRKLTAVARVAPVVELPKAA